LLSVFTYGCYESGKDVSQGGAKYHNVGVTSVAMGNLIDSLMNIKKYVYEESRYSLYDIKKMLINNFEGYEGVLSELRENKSVYGRDDDEIIEMVNKIIDCVSEEISSFASYIGERMKTGLSGAAYMDVGRGFGASFDGRKAGAPFTVHISNEDNESFTEIVNFASQLNYSNGMFNGNVLDYMISPDFINQNWDKFVTLLQGCIDAGFFEMQMNVVSSKQLIDAKNNPDAFPNLIVRVWGFSSYFNDLPDEYKDVLIQRALKNEGRVS
jgi:formate C-acetyltransferase